MSVRETCFYFVTQDGNEIIEEDELDAFVKDLMDLIKKVGSSRTRGERVSMSFLGLWPRGHAAVQTIVTERMRFQSRQEDQ